MKTKEQILEDFGCGTVPFDRNVTMYYPAILSAMEEYRNQPANTHDSHKVFIGPEAGLSTGFIENQPPKSAGETAKKTMTKAEAQEWLKDKYVKVKSLGRAKKMCDKILSLGFNVNGDHWCANEFLYFTLSGSLDQQTWEFTSMLHNDEKEIDLQDLLSIEIVEEPDPSELLKEAVAVIERIANPIKFMQDNLKEGERLNGQMAIHICNDPEYLKNIAKEFLTKHSGRV